MKCPYCSHENDEQAKICERCKAELPHDKKKSKETNKVSDKDNEKGE